MEEAKRKEAEDAKKAQQEHSSGGGDSSLITKSELRDEMRSMIRGLRRWVILGGKGVEHYLEEDCVEPANKLSPEWRVGIQRILP
ncbi:hypothetical protein U9M48_006573 [Paspalum notatum var. saurae]|uniref:Uncharacterized protein n=1 Tax=Paspalum notatum var. saurae TaxID=547442 RepID=A0AAQ3SLV6_PASNO